ncbi:MGMT family protein [Anaeromicrobium sediminis]|uniref:DNA methyltransferase n=1 Tax=Anaeromicrobium sediminis TaxID=1478221 RepID=A0A267MKQ7_9FIRM|nr:MGMT family protein [Anaeromicrobium sediminis]PAB59992.1 DNA methyltransferase [Anaeromicrobium sediminis]
MITFTLKVIEVIKNIPRGKVMTYGQIAAIGGNPRSARQVSRILHSMSRKHDLPWHRVINSQGKISLKDEGYMLQRTLLEEEGIIFESNGSINLKSYQYM